MQELKLIGVEDRELILAADDGATYRLAITPTIEAAVRPPVTVPTRPRNSPGPREIQALLRSGLSVAQVAEQTGVNTDDVGRFEAPIAAELAYMIDSARDVALRLTGAGSSDEGSSFGEIIDSRLATREVDDARWSSWKEETDWVIQLEFTSGGAGIDARWSFDPKRRVLSPINDDARSISSEEAPMPSRATRLRAIPTHGDGGRPVPSIYDRELDEGALFTTVDEPVDTAVATVTSLTERREAAPSDVVHTTDLLDALRQRRGERQPAPAAPVDHADHADHAERSDKDHVVPPTTPQAEPAPTPDAPPEPAPAPAPAKNRTHRSTMPSWDEIVFGSKGSGDDADKR